MLRLSGIVLPDNKQIEIALTYVYGIGLSLSHHILDTANIPYNKKIKDVTEEEALRIRNIIDNELTVEGDLRRKIQLDIKRLENIGSYRGKRHKLGLPVRGQRTKTNARTKRGKKRTIANKKKATK